jgi:hypothetical protein
MTLFAPDEYKVFRIDSDPSGARVVINKRAAAKCEFRTDDLTALHRDGASDAVISAMMHAVPEEQGGQAASIEPVKK